MNIEPTYLFLFITAIVFTFAGRYMERKHSGDLTTRIIEATVDRLIKDNYIKSKLDKNGEVELVKYYEE